jgi:hypothetical protein
LVADYFRGHPFWPRHHYWGKLFFNVGEQMAQINASKQRFDKVNGKVNGASKGE